MCLTSFKEEDLLKRNADLLMENQELKEAVGKLIELIKPALDQCQDVAEKVCDFVKNDLSNILKNTEGVNS